MRMTRPKAETILFLDDAIEVASKIYQPLPPQEALQEHCVVAEAEAEADAGSAQLLPQLSAQSRQSQSSRQDSISTHTHTHTCTSFDDSSSSEEGSFESSQSSSFLSEAVQSNRQADSNNSWTSVRERLRNIAQLNCLFPNTFNCDKDSSAFISRCSNIRSIRSHDSTEIANNKSPERNTTQHPQLERLSSSSSTVAQTRKLLLNQNPYSQIIIQTQSSLTEIVPHFYSHPPKEIRQLNAGRKDYSYMEQQPICIEPNQYKPSLQAPTAIKTDRIKCDTSVVGRNLEYMYIPAKETRMDAPYIEQKPIHIVEPDRYHYKSSFQAPTMIKTDKIKDDIIDVGPNLDYIYIPANEARMDALYMEQQPIYIETYQYKPSLQAPTTIKIEAIKGDKSVVGCNLEYTPENNNGNRRRPNRCDGRLSSGKVKCQELHRPRIYDTSNAVSKSPLFTQSKTRWSYPYLEDEDVLYGFGAHSRKIDFSVAQPRS